MLRLLLFLKLNLLLIPLQGQTNIDPSIKIGYTMKYKPDTNATEEIEEAVELIINDKYAYFSSLKDLKSDSIKYFGLSENEHIRGKSKELRLLKNYESMRVKRFYFILNDIFYTEEPLYSMEWTILPDTSTISGYLCQNAFTMHAGKKWIAWFSHDIPIQEGPYKFSGLPGLIIKLNDSKDLWSFDLNRIEKIKPKDILIPFEQKAKIITSEELHKKVRYYKNNAIELAEAAGLTKIPIELRKKLIEQSKADLNRRNNEID
ncbi:GLPGLI family protein [Sphingobacterium sp. xlx-130]|uniref:GLPGLI family protein n=1 Tax=Sphingobacterium sp. xlx-130 TaxID=2654323 RepID=UPI0013D972DC|nr:GLPGLI family protein [Sphingobacterium sp. xlx-130]